jgi:hypothetical protein
MMIRGYYRMVTHLPALYEFSPDTREILVAGDLHGDIDSLNRILGLWRETTGAVLLFLGDYADRGSHGVEVIETLDAIKDHPGVVLLRGNHESYPASGIAPWNPFHLKYEVQAKRGNWEDYYHSRLEPFLGKLYIAAIFPGRWLFVHGGVSTRIKGMEDLAYPSPEIENDIIWSDPGDNAGQIPNRRGCGVEFGEDVTDLILQRLRVNAIVRSHQPSLARNGPAYCHRRKVVTISSTSAYGSDYRPHILEISIHKPGVSDEGTVQAVQRAVFLRDELLF